MNQFTLPGWVLFNLFQQPDEVVTAVIGLTPEQFSAAKDALQTDEDTRKNCLRWNGSHWVIVDCKTGQIIHNLN